MTRELSEEDRQLVAALRQAMHCGGQYVSIKTKTLARLLELIVDSNQSPNDTPSEDA